MRVVFAECSVDYSGRLDAYLPKAPRLIMMKADGSVLVHSDGGSYKPLNWMSAPCTFTEAEVQPDEAEAGVTAVWLVANAKTNDALNIKIYEIIDEMEQPLGQDPGLVKDGVEAHLQELLAEQVNLLGPGSRLVRREFPTAIGPVDLMVKDADGQHVAIEVKRRGEIDGVEQLSRYLELLNRDPLLAPVTGVFAAQEIKPQARVLAEDRGIRCLVLDYGAMKGTDNVDDRLF
ncbi:endonuclease NucS [Flaviflexus huanghaiensis]|uniref:endonuclease NucS n=1 Tax=Flaviflexus huanghaiensis TaxID=1111473 RepID=UPI0015FD884B